jgi:hypothetical protein
MSPAGVHATVNYLVAPPDDGGPMPTFVTEDESRSTMQTQPATVFIADARAAEAQGVRFDLDREGFGLFPHTSSVADFDRVEEDDDVDRRYLEEVVALVREVTGATLVVAVTPPKKRFGEDALDKLAGLANAKPARFPHVDFSDASAGGALRATCPDLDTRYRRHAIYNVWRATSAPPQDIPLAVCAGNTVSRRDEIAVVSVTRTRRHGDVDAPILGYAANDEHRWYSYRDMTPREVLVFKAFDSDTARCRRVPHTAFTDPSCPSVTPTRSSIEMRVLAYFD